MSSNTCTYIDYGGGDYFTAGLHTVVWLQAKVRDPLAWLLPWLYDV